MKTKNYSNPAHSGRIALSIGRKKYKLLLINPISIRRKGLRINRDSIYPPMALAIVAAMTPDHWEVEIHDEYLEPFVYKEADLVAFTALTATINRCYEIAGEYRKNRIPTVVGGIHASLLPEEAMKYVDTVVIGEAESVWPQVIIDFENHRLQRTYTASLPDMVHAPSPRIDLFLPHYRFGSVQTSRGCPMKCEFCSVHTFNGSKYRLRAVEQSVDDFIRIPKDMVFIVDDNFVGYSKNARDHILDVFKGIVESGVKKLWFGSASMNVADDEEVLHWASESGCRLIFLGIESELIDQLERSLKQVNLKIGVDRYKEVYQKLHKYGIAVHGGFIFGLDNDTPETIMNRTRYILDSDIDIMQTAILTPLPGTDLFRRFLAEGRLLYHNFPEDWERYNYAEVVYQPHKMSVTEFEQVLLDSWEKIYDSVTLRKKFLATLKMTRNPSTAVWALTSNIHLHNFFYEGIKDPVEIKDVFPQLINDVENPTKFT